MAYRYTNTEKWGDSWFSKLRPIEMLVFIYLCDNCDIAGFIEVNMKRWAVDLNTDVRTIEGACKGLGRGILVSQEGDCFFIKNFLKHQKNLPLNKNNNSHLGILKRFDIYKHKFNFQEVNDFFISPSVGAQEGLSSPTGNGNGKEEGGVGETENLDIRKQKFESEVKSIQLEDLPDSEVEKFIIYWTEKSPKGKKMRFEMEKVFDHKRRLTTWKERYQERNTTSFRSTPINGSARTQLVDKEAEQEYIRRFTYKPQPND